ncbi:MAG TPA: NAD-dependent epimerase/dehydratase family protein [Myxococcaceae bacterium]|nr:NAD-dependent epimerase/dehydratase family protein [Myxococcaceae bacterium]
MRVFVTGGTGYIGQGVVQHLVAAGHVVTGLVRAEERVPLLTRLGARAVLGNIRDPEAYAAAAGESDALVHLGFDAGEQPAVADRTAVDTLLAAARGPHGPRTFLYTSGCLVVGKAGAAPAYEDASTAGALFNTWRPAHEELVLAAASPELATSVVRPGWVYGGDRGAVAGYFATALDEGKAAYIGEGKNRMPLIHRDDLAELYRLVLERRARGIFHAFDQGQDRVLDQATAASRAAGRGGATRSIPLEEARKTLGPWADAYCLDQWLGSRRAEALGWKPRRPFADTADQAFAEWRAARAAA